MVVTQADGLAGARQEQRCGIAQIKLVADGFEVAAVIRIRESDTGGAQAVRGNFLDEKNLVTQPAEAKNVLEHSPSGTSLPGVGGNHAAYDQSAPRFHGSFKSTAAASVAITMSESKNSSATWRAA